MGRVRQRRCQSPSGEWFQGAVWKSVLTLTSQLLIEQNTTKVGFVPGGRQWDDDDVSFTVFQAMQNFMDDAIGRLAQADQ